MMKFNQGWQRKSASAQSLKPRLQGHRVVLRPPCADDYSRWSVVRARNKDHLVPFEPQWAKDCLSREFFDCRLDRQQKEWDGGRGAFFLIHDKFSDDIIGGINLNNIQHGSARNATLGYWIDQDMQGQGYMREAAQLVIAYAFDHARLHRLNAACLPENERSVKLLLGLGFEEEGFAKSYFQINGKWQDHRLFGLLNNTKL